MFHFVYLTANQVNGKIYIGVHSTDNVDDGYLGTGRIFKLAKKKYGKENFHRTILAFHETRDQANQHEMDMVDLDFISREDVYNCQTGGKNGFHSKETRAKISARNSLPKTRIAPAWNKGMRGVYSAAKRGLMPDEVKQKISETKRLNPVSRSHSAATRLKISESSIGKPSTFKGRKHTPETLMKMSESRKRVAALKRISI